MKKKLFVFVAAAMMATGAFAQTEKGKILVSGSSELSFSSVNFKTEYDGEKLSESDDATNSFNLKPSLGYFVINNLAITASIDYSSTSVGDYKSSELTFAPGARYYFGTSNVKPFVMTELSFGSSNDDDGEEEEKFGIFGWSIGAGASIFMTDAIALDAILGYGVSTYTNKDDDKYKMEASGLALQVGFTFCF